MPAQFLCWEGLFRVFSFLQLLRCIHKKRKKDFISLLLLEQNAFGKDCCLWQQAKGFLKGRFLFHGWNSRHGNQSSRLQQLFIDTLHSGGPFPSCWQSICICEPEFSTSGDTHSSNHKDAGCHIFSYMLPYILFQIINLVKNGVKFYKPESLYYLHFYGKYDISNF